jgi:ParB-like chromosome segregation protein Spo0J
MTGPTMDSAWLRIQDGLAAEVVVISLAALSPGNSPRQTRLNIDHARMLADVEEELPPIIVRAETMTVVDGHHRVFAARLRGKSSIPARMFKGNEHDAFLLGVHCNLHGNSLSPSERLLAASQVLLTMPEMSDREVARFCGVSARSVATRRKAGPTVQQVRRVGGDGRIRPLSTQLAREQARELMILFPDDSNRKIARSVGVSEGTVRNVRHEMARPVAPSSKTRGDSAARATSDPSPPEDRSSTRSSLPLPMSSEPDGARFARWLTTHSISDASWTELLDDIAISDRTHVIADALRISESWRRLASRLEEMAYPGGVDVRTPSP